LQNKNKKTKKDLKGCQIPSKSEDNKQTVKIREAYG
jgi:hypothetical protein